MYGSRSFADAICQAGIERQKNYQTQNRREGMSKGNEPAYPSSKTWNDDNGNWGIPYGLTKREYFAGLAMQGILSTDSWINLVEVDARGPEVCLAIAAVQYADALAEQLEKTA